MNRNVLYVVIALLAVTSGVLGYQYYQETKQKDGVEISVGKRGLSIEAK